MFIDELLASDALLWGRVQCMLIRKEKYVPSNAIAGIETTVQNERYVSGIFSLQ
jgi:hypothetical protein